MKAFLSHSSRDKGFVDQVAEALRPGTYELDSETFDSGALNSQAIISALKRCDVFCLFLSVDSVKSSYVDFEVLVGTELLAKGVIRKIVVFCLDQEAFYLADSNIKMFNIVRLGLNPDSVARHIQGIFIGLNEDNNDHPFIGREKDLILLERQVTDVDRPLTKAIFVSGNFGSGRRSFVKRFYSGQFPSAKGIFPRIEIA